MPKKEIRDALKQYLIDLMNGVDDIDTASTGNISLLLSFAGEDDEEVFEAAERLALRIMTRETDRPAIVQMLPTLLAYLGLRGLYGIK